MSYNRVITSVKSLTCESCAVSSEGRTRWWRENVLPARAEAATVFAVDCRIRSRLRHTGSRQENRSQLFLIGS